MNIQTAQCPQCPAVMIRRSTNQMLPSNPPQIVTEWWCNCGYREPAGADRVGSYDNTYEQWHAANDGIQARAELAALAHRPWWRRLLP